jgi:hypothetical protein
LPAVLRSRLGWLSAVLFSSTYRDDPGFAWNGAWVVTLNVPPGASATQPGRIAVAEYAGEPVYRDVTISRFACDFRPADPGGINGPVFHGNGIGVDAL